MTRTQASREGPSLGIDRVPQKLWFAFLILLNLATLLMIAKIIREAARQPLQFDDAFMFQRYATHFREGMGISWNPDRIPTAGMTSLGWFLAVIPVSFFPLYRGQPLAIESSITGILGIAWMAYRISRLASFPWFRRLWLILPALVLLIAHDGLFRYNMVTGMDTMLSFAVLGALSCSLWMWCKVESARLAVVVGALGACSVIVRPENGLFAVLAPLLAALLLLDRGRRHEVLRTALTFGGILTIYLVLYRVYFKTWLPLSFYMKSQHPYRGYIAAWFWAPEIFLHQFLLFALAILVFPLLCADRRTVRIAVTYLLPLLLTFAYLETVTQIMGYGSRYYLPFIAPVVVAAFWMSDVALGKDWRRLIVQRWWKAAAVVVVLVILNGVAYPRIVAWSQRRLHITPFPAAKLNVAAASPLPAREWFSTITVLANRVIEPLPAGSVVATTEVGLIGAAAPQVGIIDLAGLNDRQIAMDGFSMERLLARKPLLIWFPHSDYTWQRRQMFCSPDLLRNYILIGGNAFNFSLAVRRNTPQTGPILEHVQQAFEQLYPGVPMDQYIVSSIDCS